MKYHLDFLISVTEMYLTTGNKILTTKGGHDQMKYRTDPVIYADERYKHPVFEQETLWDLELYPQVDFEYLCESTDLSKSYIIRDGLYQKVRAVLKTPAGDMRFKQTVGRYVDKNSQKLHTPGPQYLVPFGDIDKGMFYKIFDITEEEINASSKQIIAILKGAATNTNFQLLKNNPIFFLFYCCIRYYTIETKDERGLNTALIIYALSVYPSIFSKYFKYGVSDVGAMLYTVDNLTEKFILKKTGHVFGMLATSIQSSYSFLKDFMQDGSDKEVVRFIQRIRNDQNSLIKKICDNYTKNHAAGKTVTTVKDQFGDSPVMDGNENNTTLVSTITSKVSIPLITNGIDLKRAEICAKLAKISISDTRFYLSKIVSGKNESSIQGFIESILFLFLYTDQKQPADINSSYFLTWSAELFRKTNSNDANIARIKTILDQWAESSGVHAKFKREASRINYKKAIFFYFILSIQAYNN